MNKSLTLFSCIVLLCLSTFSHAATVSKKQEGISKSLNKALNSFLYKKKHGFSTMAYDADGHWVVVAPNGARYYSSTKHFDKKKGFRKKLNKLLKAKRKVEAIAFTPGGNWVIVLDNDVYYSSIKGFKQIGFFQKMEDLKEKKGFKVQSVSFGPTGTWAIVANRRAYFSMDKFKDPDVKKSEIVRVFNELNQRDEKVDFVSMRVKKKGIPEYVAVSGSKVVSYPKNIKLDNAVHDYATAKLAVEYGVLGPGQSFVIFHKGGRPKLTDARKMELSVPYRTNCNNQGKKCKTKRDSIWNRMAYHKVAGVQVALIENNQVSDVLTYGYRHYGLHQPVYKNSMFSSASLSKAVAGYGFLKAAETHNLWLEGSLTFDVRYYIDKHKKSYLGKWYKRLSKKEEKRVKGAYVGDLLAHTAGYNVHGIGLYDVKKQPSLEKILRGKKPWKGDDVKPVRSPRVAYDYSGGGYVLAQAIFHKETHEKFDHYMNERVLKKLGMHTSSFKRLSESRISNDLVRAHDKNYGARAYKECPSDTAGGLYTSAGDYAKFVISLMNEGRVKANSNQRILAEKAVEQMTMPRVLKGGSGKSCSINKDCKKQESCWSNRCEKMSFYGYGVSLSQSRDSENRPITISHTGSQEGYRTFFAAYPSEGKGIVIFLSGEKELSTRRGAEEFRREIFDRFLEVY